MNIHKTFSDILEDALVEKFNPNHDKLGRFTTSGGGGVITNNTSSAGANGGFKKVGEYKENGKTISYGESDFTRKIKSDLSASKDPEKESKIDTIYEKRSDDGETLGWKIGIKNNKRHTVHVENTSGSDDIEDMTDEFFGGVIDARDCLNYDIDAMEGFDLEHFDMYDGRWPDEIEYKSSKTYSEEFLENPLEFEIVELPEYVPATWDSPEEYHEGELWPADGSDPYAVRDALNELVDLY